MLYSGFPIFPKEGESEICLANKSDADSYVKLKAESYLGYNICAHVVSVAQRPKAPGCGPGDRGFKSLHSPHLYSLKIFYPVNKRLQINGENQKSL